MSNKYFYESLLHDILQYYEDLEDTIIHSPERQGEWEDPTYDKAKRLIELSQYLHRL